MNGKNLVDGTPAAKQLGIYLGQLYGWVKSGKLKNYKKDGKYVVDGGKGLIVDMDEALAVWKSSSKKTPKKPGEPRAKRTTKRSANGGDEVVAERKARQLAGGTIASWETGKNLSSTKLGPPKYTIAQVLGSTSRLTYMDSGERRRAYDGTVIDNIVFGTERLSTMLAKGVARIEHPVPVLGMVILSFIMEGKVELAEDLEKWLIKHDLSVIIPELMDLEEEPEEPIRGKPVMIEAEQLAGEEDDDDGADDSDDD